MDVLTKEQRRKNMQNIKATDTKIEIILRKALWKKGYRYRKNWNILKKKLENSNNSEFWINKIERNRKRDDEINKRLFFEGWTVIRFWGEEIKKHTEECVKVVEETIFDQNIVE